MVEVLVWLLIVSGSRYEGATPRVLERFKTQEQCQHVRNSISPVSNYGISKCVQANILVPK